MAPAFRWGVGGLGTNRSGATWLGQSLEASSLAGHCGNEAPPTLFQRPLDRFRGQLDIVQVQHLEATLAKGTVKWFNATKGYGFIQPMGGGRDVFVHISAVERAGLSTLNEGQTGEYDEVSNRGRNAAENLKVVR